LDDSDVGAAPCGGPRAGTWARPYRMDPGE